MADYVPFLGLEDLREILTAVLHRKARSVKDSRPLKVTNYLKVRHQRGLSLQTPPGLRALAPPSASEASLNVGHFSVQGEAVRLVRQLPPGPSRADVEDTLRRMERQLGEKNGTCIHGRPFLQHIGDVPASEEEAREMLRPLEL